MRWLYLGVTAVVVLSAHVARADGSPTVGTVDGEPIVAGSLVQVPVGSTKQLVFADGGRVTLHGGAAVQIFQPQWYPPEQGDKAVRGARLFLRAGELQIHLPPRAGGRTALSVAGSGGQMALVWRGVSHVGARDGDMRVAVDDGATYVGAQERWLRLNAGSAVVMRKKAPPESAAGRLDAGNAASGAGLGFVVDKERVPVRVAWAPVPEATGYWVDIAADEAMTQVLETIDVPSTAQTVEARLAGGTYYAQIHAMNPDGLPGYGSRPKPVRVVRIGLSSGAVRAPDGVLLMTQQSSVALDARSGFTAVASGGFDVSSAVGAARGRATFTPAPASFRLEGFRARAVRVRDDGGAEGLLAMAGRELRARVSMLPVHARWPAQPIDVAVDLEDPTKRIDSTHEPVISEVRIDGQPIPSEWVREGSTLRTRIAPVVGPGPWLVSVVVKDSNGAEIGSYILDVDGPRPFDLDTLLAERNGLPPPAAVAAGHKRPPVPPAVK